MESKTGLAIKKKYGMKLNKRLADLHIIKKEAVDLLNFICISSLKLLSTVQIYRKSEIVLFWNPTISLKEH